MRVIKAAQRLGFTLEEVGDLLAATRLSGRTDAGLQAPAVASLAEVDRNLAGLKGCAMLDERLVSVRQKWKRSGIGLSRFRDDCAGPS